MIAIIPILAWTGGIAAGARVGCGVVRGVRQLIKGHPVAALIEVADGVVGPFTLASQELSKLGSEVYSAVLGGDEMAVIPEMPLEDLPARRPRRSKASGLRIVPAAGPASAG